MSWKKFICIIMSFKIKRHNMTRVISWWFQRHGVIPQAQEKCRRRWGYVFAIRLKNQHFFWVFLSVCPLRRSISTVDRFFFVWTDRYVRYRPISGYYEPNRPLISTVILRRCNLTDRRYRPCCPEGGTEPTVDIDRDQPTGRLKPTDRTDDTCENENVPPAFKGGPEPLEKEIHKILGRNVRIDIPTLC